MLLNGHLPHPLPPQLSTWCRNDPHTWSKTEHPVEEEAALFFFFEELLLALDDDVDTNWGDVSLALLFRLCCFVNGPLMTSWPLLGCSDTSNDWLETVEVVGATASITGEGKECLKLEWKQIIQSLKYSVSYIIWSTLTFCSKINNIWSDKASKLKSIFIRKYLEFCPILFSC